MSSQLPIPQCTEFHLFISQLRSRLFETQKEVADYFGCSRSMITKYESETYLNKPV